MKIFILKKTLTIDKNGLTDMSGEMFLKMIKNSKINLKELRIKENCTIIICIWIYLY